MGVCANKENKRDSHIHSSRSKSNNTSDHPMDGSVKFQDMPEWEGEKYKGEGVKRMKGYICNIPIDELYKIREEFWHNRFKTGVVWRSLRQACTMDDVRASNIIHSLGLRTVKGCINELTDGKGNYYRIPNFCINDPYFEKIIEGASENSNRIPNLIKFYLYDLYKNKKVKFETLDNIKGKELKELYFKMEEIKNSDDYYVRLFFGGAEILDDHMLFKHNVKNEFTLQIMFLPKNL